MSASPTTPRTRQGDTSAGRRVSGARLLAALGLWIAMAGGAGLGTWAGLAAALPGWASADRLSILIVAEVYLALIVALMLAFGGASGLRDRLRLGRTSARDIRSAVAVWAGCWLAAPLVTLVLSPLLGSLDEFADVLLRIGSDWGRLAWAGPLLFVLILLRVCLLAPLAEELLFRGALYGWLRQHLNVVASILLSAVAFAAVHQSLVLMPAAVILGSGLAWVREHTGSTTPVFVAHVLNNVAFVVVAYLVTGWAVPR